MAAYQVPLREARFEQEIRKSRFIGIAAPARSPEEALVVRRSLKAEFPDATHHCWAHLLGNPETAAQMRMDDDGEPSGTAGKPILNVLQHKKVGDVVVVVVRYFGGTKLGAGGLVRAYSSTANGVMERVETTTTTPSKQARLTLDYADEPSVRRILDELEIPVGSCAYGAAVELLLRLPEEVFDELVGRLADRTSGRAKLVAI